MSAFIDARCTKCSRKIGWFGTMLDMPPCPKCGHEHDRASLAEDQAKMDEAERLMFLHPRDAKPNDLQKQRVQAGLTLRQAAVQLGVFPSDLSAWENGRAELPVDVAQRMASCYQCAADPEYPHAGP